MLLKITRKCSMKCTHCMENATPDGKHMSMEVFNQAKEFIRNMNPIVLLVSGGEPFENPRALDMIEDLARLLGKHRVLVASNGTFRYNREMESAVQRLGVQVQVVNDSRYYPMSVPMQREGNIMTFDRIESMYPQGRAVKNNIPIKNVKASKCYNLRSIGINNARSFFETVKILESYNKWCVPSIGIDGKVLMGESSLCANIGTIWDTDEVLLQNLRKSKCDKCKLISKLPLHYRKRINM